MRRSGSEYDGLQRRVRTAEKEGAAVQSDLVHVACSTSVCEYREAMGGIVRQRLFTNGVLLTSDLSAFV